MTAFAQSLYEPAYPGGFQALRASTDWAGVGLMMAIVGSFLLANAILFRHPRGLVAEHFSGRRQRLTSIREYIFHRVNIHLGFLFLLGGFGLQLFGHMRPPAPEATDFPTVWVGLILLVAVGLEVVGWWWSHRLFRRYVRLYLLEHPADFETEAGLAREVGELFGIPSSAEDTVESYVARLRAKLGISVPARGDQGRSGGMVVRPASVGSPARERSYASVGDEDLV